MSFADCRVSRVIPSSADAAARRMEGSDSEQIYPGRKYLSSSAKDPARQAFRFGAAQARGTYTVVAGRSRIAPIFPLSLRKSTSRAVLRVNPGDL
jgi:hypothetical protein